MSDLTRRIFETLTRRNQERKVDEAARRKREKMINEVDKEFESFSQTTTDFHTKLRKIVEK